MGLDITYAAGVTRVACTDEQCDHEHLYIDPDFPTHAAPLAEGHYAAGEGGWRDFHAGSYGGYNMWRDKLARLAGAPSARAMWTDRETYQSYPFYELVNFSDCDGAIGPEVSRKLAADFNAMAEQARALGGNDGFFRLYQQFRAAFTTAQHDGVVCFH